MPFNFVKAVYADHNASRAVVDHIGALLERFGAEGTMVNLGAGQTRLHPRMQNVEIEPGPQIDIVASVTDLPFADNSVDLVVTQEVLEHVPLPLKAMEEIRRVLKPGGIAFVQLPFIIGDHPCPNDYWRFTREGIVELARQAGFTRIERHVTVGSGTGFYRIGVEFWAILLSLLTPGLYRYAKGAAAIVLYPLKWLDPLFRHHPEAHRVAGGFFIIATKD